MNYTQAQEEVFFQKFPKRFTIVSKGRRVGLTRGAAQAFVEYALQSKVRMLWGETIFSNVQRYFELYFLPLLEQLPVGSWEWRTKMMQLRIFESIIDFRSADNPEMWEGFGYEIIFINEAGIILRDPNLYKKTILPMLMDYPNSRLIAAGVPKGKKIKGGHTHPFFELWEKGSHDKKNYRLFKFSSYSNPYLSRQNIKEIEEALDEKVRLQEIYGEFIDLTDNPFLYAFDAGTHTIPMYDPDPKIPIWLSFDFNIEPNSCIVGQLLNNKEGRIFDEVSVSGSTEEVCNKVLVQYQHWVDRGMVFVTGDATGRNRNAMSGETTNYLIIKKLLRLNDYNLKVKLSNMLVKASRILVNSVLSRGNVRITTDCIRTISDCQLANVDASGELIKDTGMHKLDCFRYMIEAWYPEFLTREYKYINPNKQ
jgi:hypothetical protein